MQIKTLLWSILLCIWDREEKKEETLDNVVISEEGWAWILSPRQEDNTSIVNFLGVPAEMFDELLSRIGNHLRNVLLSNTSGKCTTNVLTTQWTCLDRINTVSSTRWTCSRRHGRNISTTQVSTTFIKFKTNQDRDERGMRIKDRSHVFHTFR